MPHHNRAILAVIEEQNLDPAGDYVASKDGSLTLDPKTARDLKLKEETAHKEVVKSQPKVKKEQKPEIVSQPVVEVAPAPPVVESTVEDLPAETIEETESNFVETAVEEIKETQKKKFKVKKSKDLDQS